MRANHAVFDPIFIQYIIIKHSRFEITQTITYRTQPIYTREVNDNQCSTAINDQRHRQLMAP
jgi:hypothetical protein